MEHLRLLSVSAASGKIGFVLFIGDRPTYWALSRKASNDAEAAARYMQDLVKRFRPDVIMIELAGPNVGCFVSI